MRGSPGTRLHARRPRTSRGLAMAVLCAVFAVAGCGLRYLRPPGVGPLRYRDPVFNAVSRTTDVTYGSAVNEQGQPISLTLDVYTPAGDSNTSRPAIVWLHGGSDVGGDKTSVEIVDEANTLATKGYVTVSINYRLSSAVCPQRAPPSVCDVASLH